MKAASAYRLLAWPGKLTAGETLSPMHAVDWMPTLCSLVGATPAGDLKWDGIDIWPA